MTNNAIRYTILVFFTLAFGYVFVASLDLLNDPYSVDAVPLVSLSGLGAFGFLTALVVRLWNAGK